MGHPDHLWLVSDQTDVDRDVTEPGMHPLDQGNIVPIGIHHLTVVDGNVLAPIIRE
jgi:hypothetical protein